MAPNEYTIDGAFARRHIGPRSKDVMQMLSVGYDLGSFMDDAVPSPPFY